MLKAGASFKARSLAVTEAKTTSIINARSSYRQVYLKAVQYVFEPLSSRRFRAPASSVLVAFKIRVHRVVRVGSSLARSKWRWSERDTRLVGRNGVIYRSWSPNSLHITITWCVTFACVREPLWNVLSDRDSVKSTARNWVYHVWRVQFLRCISLYAGLPQDF